jgi:diguanylate cyclase (GGDEF)-like protein/PAS domain S-box-containing protein
VSWYLAQIVFLLKIEKTVHRTFTSIFHRFSFSGFLFRNTFPWRAGFSWRKSILHFLPISVIGALFSPSQLFAQSLSTLIAPKIFQTPVLEGEFFSTPIMAGTFVNQIFRGDPSIYAFCLGVFLVLTLFFGLSLRRSSSRGRSKMIRDLLNSLPCPAWFKDKQLRFIAANKTFFEKTGLDQRKIFGKKAADICPSLKDIFPEVHGQRVLDSAVALRVNQEPLHPYSGEAMKDTFRAPVINDRGEVDGILGLSMDRNNFSWNAETEIKAGLEYPAFFMDVARVGILSIVRGTPTSRILKANRGAENVLQHSCSEIVDYPFTLFLAEEDLYPVSRAIRHLFVEGGSSFSRKVTLIRKSGQLLPVLLSLTPLYSDNGSVEEINAVFHTMPEEVKESREDRRGCGSYERILAQGPFGLFRSACDGRFLDVNSALVQMLGFDSREDLLAGIMDVEKELFVDPKGCSRIFQTMRDASVLQFFETVLRRRDGHYIDVSISLTPLDCGEGGETVVEGMVQDISERKVREKKIWQMAYLDALTKLPNLSLLRDKVKNAIEEAQRVGHGVALVSIDIDRFKEINHSLGIARGDKFLQIISQKLSRYFSSENQIVSRVEGDNFVIFLSRILDESEISRTLRGLQKMLGEPFRFDSQEIFITASAGVSVYPRHGLEFDTLLKNANLAMHVAKDCARGTTLFYSPDMNTEALEQRDMECRLRRALQNNEFNLYYQPQVDLMTRRITGVEALIRWNDPEKGFISPEIFIPVAEKCGLIRSIGEWVLKTVSQHSLYWQANGFPPLRFSVNLSGHQLKQPDLLEIVDGALLGSTLLPNSLELELTESIFMAPVDVTVKTLRELKARGINLAIDDFGTGYSSLNYLKHFPIDRLKIDQSFVRDIVTEKDDAAIVEAIIAMARTLGIGVIAEGVETREQLEFLRGRQCHEMQGYYFARPMPIEEMNHYFHIMKNGFSAKLAKKFSQLGFSRNVPPYS